MGLWFWGASLAPHPQGDRNRAESGAGCGVASSAFVQIDSKMAMPGDFQRAAQEFMCPCGAPANGRVKCLGWILAKFS